MNKDLHDMDDLFHAALEGHEEMPSAGLKERLDAALDKKEAEKYKKRFIFWKRVSLLLLLLLAGFVLFDSGVIKKRSSPDTANNSATVNDKVPGDAKPKSFTNNNTSTNTVTVNPPAIDNNNRTAPQNPANIIPMPGNIQSRDKGIAGSKNQQPHKIFNAVQQKQDPLFSVNSPQPGRKTNDLPTNNSAIPTNIPGIEPLNTRTGIAATLGLFPKKMFSLSSIVPGNPAPLAVKINNPGKKKTNPFKPYWLFSPFVSYDQAGYKLDSDDPLAITTIKYREVNEPSFSGGLLIARQFSESFSLQSGLIYTSTQIGISPQKMFALQLPGGDIAYKFISSSGYAYIKLKNGQLPAVGDSITTSDAKHLLKHTSIPLSIKYKLGNNKLTFSPTVGIEANFITSAKVEVGIDLASNREVVTVNKLNGIRSFYWSANTGVEVSYRVNKKLLVNLQPVYRHALSPITKENVVETFPRSFGVRAGITIKF